MRVSAILEHHCSQRAEHSKLTCTLSFKKTKWCDLPEHKLGSVHQELTTTNPRHFMKQQLEDVRDMKHGRVAIKLSQETKTGFGQNPPSWGKEAGVCAPLSIRRKGIMTRQHTQNFISPTFNGITVSHQYMIGDLLCYMTLSSDSFSPGKTQHLTQHYFLLLHTIT